MGKKSILIMHALGVLVFMIAVFMISMPLSAQSPVGSSSGGSSNVYLLGIIDPDGHKHIWAFPAETAIVVSKQLAAKSPGKTIDGVSFFRVTSWRDTSNLAIEANAQQGLIIADLFKEIQHLKSNTPGAQLAHRVNRLENQLREMTGPGYR
jgi:uncharacterized membrane protein YciS (DUF1049 family)